MAPSGILTQSHGFSSVPGARSAERLGEMHGGHSAKGGGQFSPLRLYAVLMSRCPCTGACFAASGNALLHGFLGGGTSNLRGSSTGSSQGPSRVVFRESHFPGETGGPMNPKNRMSFFRAPARMLLALTALGAVALPTLAASSGQGTQPAPRATATAPNAQRPNTPLKVSYYAGDPQKGGKLISTVTLTPPQRTQGQGGPSGQAQPQPGTGSTTDRRASRPNPIVDQAPKGATFAVIRDAQGRTRTIDLAHPNFGMRGPGGRDQTNRTPTPGGTPPTR